MLYIAMETMAMCLEKLYKNYLVPKSFRFPEGILGSVAVSVISALKFLKDTLVNYLFKILVPTSIP